VTLIHIAKRFLGIKKYGELVFFASDHAPDAIVAEDMTIGAPLTGPGHGVLAFFKAYRAHDLLRICGCRLFMSALIQLEKMLSPQ